jgi:hypothetical protein
MPRASRLCNKCKCIAVYRVAVIQENLEYTRPIYQEIDVQKLCPEHWISFVADATAKGYSVEISPLYLQPKQKGGGK